MSHIITSLCLRDGACVDVCPVECIIAGKPEDEWPLFFIDPNTCIDCVLCVPDARTKLSSRRMKCLRRNTMKPGQQLTCLARVSRPSGRPKVAKSST